MRNCRAVSARSPTEGSFQIRLKCGTDSLVLPYMTLQLRVSATGKSGRKRQPRSRTPLPLYEQKEKGNEQQQVYDACRTFVRPLEKVTMLSARVNSKGPYWRAPHPIEADGRSSY